MKNAYAVLLVVSFTFSLPLAVDAQENSPATEETVSINNDSSTETPPQKSESDNNLFLTIQFGGGSMITTGVGIIMFDSAFRPELQIGYTPGDQNSGFTASLRAALHAINIHIDETNLIFLGLGSNYTFFSNSGRVSASLFGTFGFDIPNIPIFSSLILYTEGHVFFLESEISPYLFQLAAGLRVAL